MLKRIIVIALAYFGVTVGAGFASGQEILQYYVSYGWWGIVGAAIALVVIPLTAMSILQYGSYFRAESHGKVFDSISTKIMAKFMDYSLTVAQFCIGFVMLAGAGSNLNQQFGLPLWVGSTLMIVLIMIAGMLDVDRVTNIISSITPAMVILLVVAALSAIFSFDGSIQQVHDYALEHAAAALPHWLLAALNYIGLAMFSGIAMAILIGGSNWSPQVAGWGGFIGGALFGVILMLMSVGLLLQIETVVDADLPTLALINEIHPVLGVIASVATYLMIFSTALGVLYATGKRVAVVRPSAYRPIFVVVTLVAFCLSFVPFTALVNNVFPVLGWLGILFVAVLLGTWLLNGRHAIGEEIRRRDRIRVLILRRLNPKRSWTAKHTTVLEQQVVDSNLEAEELGEFVGSEVYVELEETTGIEIPVEVQEQLGHQLAEKTLPDRADQP